MDQPIERNGKRASARERFLEAVLHSAIDYAIVSMDLDGLVTIWNEGASRILGWSEEEMLGKPAAIFFTTEDRRAGIPQAEMKSSLEQGRGADERWHLRKDGTQFWASGEMMVLRSENGSAEGFLKILRDRTEERQAVERQKLLMHELNHRLKNSLAVVQSIITQSLRNAGSIEEGGAALQSRIAAYSRAHDILLHENWTSTTVAAVVEASAVSLGLEGSPRLRFEGSPVLLGPQAALSLSLVLHELGTNATKYGALSGAEGQVSVTWSVADEDGAQQFTFRWEESGGPEVEQPTRTGFGSRLVVSSLKAYGDVSLDYQPSGVMMRFQAPLSKLQRGETEGAATSA